MSEFCGPPSIDVLFRFSGFGRGEDARFNARLKKRARSAATPYHAYGRRTYVVLVRASDVPRYALPALTTTSAHLSWRSRSKQDRQQFDPKEAYVVNKHPFASVLLFLTALQPSITSSMTVQE
ncbi:hypothetical protein QE152_g31961 [Popillia japonica]|uniref:Uncharacterized protein n=1 Tax=Popillia japonica TaxID=7064 RepID=A0AAW1J0H9_POPJA